MASRHQLDNANGYRVALTPSARSSALWRFASGKLDPTWSLAQLEASIVAGGRVHPDHLVAERLAAVRNEHLPAVLLTLELLIEPGTRPWFVIGARDEIEAILVNGLAAN